MVTYSIHYYYSRVFRVEIKVKKSDEKVSLLSPMDSGFFSETSSCGSSGLSTPLKQRFGSLMTPPSAPKAYKYRKNPRHKVKRRLFDSTDSDSPILPKKLKKYEPIIETINFETEVCNM